MPEIENLWEGRFTEKLQKEFEEFNRSFKFDRRLFEADIKASIAYCNALFDANLITKIEREKINGALTTLLKRARYNPGFFDEMEAEDVHSFIETKLIQLVGDAGKKLHTGRSRNEQVATAFRIWLRDKLSELDLGIKELQIALIKSAETNIDAIMPGYTHLQRAQPILWAHWCLAYFEMLRRDRQRFSENYQRINILPLGSGALAGTSYEIDRKKLANELGFKTITRNSVDAVSDRDFAIEFLSNCSLLMIHLSRFAEDLILFSSQEFDFLELSDAIATGSSLMPQKKNPDALELIRGKTGRVLGNHLALLTVLKGLPLAYNKDMQEDKEAVFDSFDTVIACVRVARIVMENLRLKKNAMLEAANHGYLNATDLADYMVNKGIPFRTAHNITGKIVLYSMQIGKKLEELTLEEMRKFCELIEEDVFQYITIENSLSRKTAIGGTAPERVKEAIEMIKKELETESQEESRESEASSE